MTAYTDQPLPLAADNAEPSALGPSPHANMTDDTPASPPVCNVVVPESAPLVLLLSPLGCCHHPLSHATPPRATTTTTTHPHFRTHIRQPA
ncbi:hypothetical protein H257_11230 [Aphanomyces astaci]|uniref:Uncharacterized protein n=1 Tax=Aphanomyces astaci TaxID=112090 RepID=W4G4U1_APHAT|nr:hypothetical protein H257_11230 [Aphanomyces astaci]ETV74306.1 hypothetical protein H257_11230 [Aphanomyces astaci]|eukprot:XP_009836412.1 hypothetical protein H257_11230 [Aphanomyces astaci]